MRSISLYTQSGLIGGGALTAAFGLGAASGANVTAGAAALGCGFALLAYERLRHLRQGNVSPNAQSLEPGNVQEAAAETLKAAYPIFGRKDYATTLSSMAERVAKEWTERGNPPLIEPIVHSEVQRLAEYMSSRALKPAQATLLEGLRGEQRKSALQPSAIHWKQWLLSGALAAGASFLLSATVSRLTAPHSVDQEEARPPDQRDICRRAFPSERFSTKPEKPLPVPAKLYVPAWMKKDAKAQQKWILSRFVPTYLDYFECLWTERGDLNEGLRQADFVLDAWNGEGTVELGQPDSVTIPSSLFRRELADKIFQKYPQLSLHRILTEEKKKDPQRGVRGPDVPPIGKTTDYEGFTYANLGTRMVRWPQDSQKIALEKELWDETKGQWVKCLPKEAHP